MLNRLRKHFRKRRLNIVKPFGVDLKEDTLKLTLCDTNPDLVQQWAKLFATVDAVEVIEGDLLDTNVQALVSPANSFGDMGGGVDKRIDDFFEGQAQNRIRAAIAEQFYGELPVGVAVVVPMPSERFSFVVAAPTMRVPGRVGESLNAYLAMRGLLVATLRHNDISGHPLTSLAIPGLGTGVGGIPAEDAALQMRAAYENIIEVRWKTVVSPALAPFAYQPKVRPTAEPDA